MNYIVNLSGGLTSFEALRRTIERYGREQTIVLFTDTLIEDPDLYRFLDDQERYFNITINRLADGRTPFDVWHDARAIRLKLPNGVEIAPCSKILKRELGDKWIRDNFELGTYTRVFGMSWDESHRMERLEAELAPVPVWFPLAERPFVDKCHIADFLESIGISPPLLYKLGFSHNNCGGGCVKGGQAHWALLWRKFPDRYAIWEAREARFLAEINPAATILRDRRGGVTKPLSLTEFRERLERGEGYDRDEWGGCGCFAPVVQERMDILLLETDVKG